MPAGRRILTDMIKWICDLAQFTGYRTKHSLRSTAATRLYDIQMDEQLISQVTGHRSSLFVHIRVQVKHRNGRLVVGFRGLEMPRQIVRNLVMIMLPGWHSKLMLKIFCFTSLHNFYVWGHKYMYIICMSILMYYLLCVCAHVCVFEWLTCIRYMLYITSGNGV